MTGDAGLREALTALADDAENDPCRTSETYGIITALELRAVLAAHPAPTASVTELELAALQHAIEVYTGPDDDTIPVLQRMAGRLSDDLIDALNPEPIA